MSARAPIRVMLVDDNETVRKGLQEALEHAEDFAVVGRRPARREKKPWGWRRGSCPMSS